MSKKPGASEQIISLPKDGGAIGQFDIGVLSGGSYTLSGGFWSGAASLGASRVYLPIVLR